MTDLQQTFELLSKFLSQPDLDPTSRERIRRARDYVAIVHKELYGDMPRQPPK